MAYTLLIRADASPPDTQVVVGIGWVGALPRTPEDTASIHAIMSATYRALSSVLPPEGAVGAVADSVSQIVYTSRTGARGLRDLDVRRALDSAEYPSTSGPAATLPRVRVAIRAGAEDSTLREIADAATRPARAAAETVGETAARGAREIVRRGDDAIERATEVVQTGIEAGGRAAIAFSITQVVLGVIAIGVLLYLLRRGTIKV